MAKDKNDKIFEEVISRQLQGLRIDAAERRELRNQLRKLQAKIVAAIATLAPTEVTAQRYRNIRLDKLLDGVKKDISEIYSEIGASHSKAMRLYGEIESEAMASLAAAVGIEAARPGKSELNAAINAVLIQGAPSQEWWSRQRVDLQQKFTDQMRQGVLAGESTQQLIQRVRGTRAQGFSDGIMATTTRNAEALVRTSVQRVGNESRKMFWDNNLDIIEAYQHVSVLDSRTSFHCIPRDGLMWEADTLKPIGHSVPFQNPPIHWNCRSSMIAKLKGVEQADDAVRSSEDGAVPASVKFEDFLKRKPKEWQDEVLGKGKAELWRKGRITFTDLLDQSGNPLTLQELKSQGAT